MSQIITKQTKHNLKRSSKTYSFKGFAKLEIYFSRLSQRDTRNHHPFDIGKHNNLKNNVLTWSEDLQVETGHILCDLLTSCDKTIDPLMYEITMKLLKTWSR